MAAHLSWVTGSTKNSLYFDVVREEELVLTASATENPVESGANVADHVRQELERVSLEVVVSNTPVIGDRRGGVVSALPLEIRKNYSPPILRTPGAAVVTGLRSLASSSADQVLAANVLNFPRAFDAIKETLETLERLQREATLVTVFLPSRVCNDLFLESISFPRNARDGARGIFKLDFKQIRKVEARIVTAPIPTEVRGASKVNKGVQGTKETDPKQKKSTAKAIANGLPDGVKSKFGLK